MVATESIVVYNVNGVKSGCPAGIGQFNCRGSARVPPGWATTLPGTSTFPMAMAACWDRFPSAPSGLLTIGSHRG